MLKLFLAIILISVLVKVSKLSNSLTEDHNDKWEEFKLKFNKNYEGEDEIIRRIIWERNLEHIEEHNIQYNLGVSSYYLEVNQFSDLTEEEFQKKYLNSKLATRSNKIDQTKFWYSMNKSDLPKEVDWRKNGYVTRMKFQLDCGSCYAFSAIGALEGQYFKKTKKLKDFSEQQIIDCGSYYGNFGCGGGYPWNVYDYLIAKGSELYEDYPYDAMNGVCKYNASKVITEVHDYKFVESRNEKALEEAVATVGPISVAIDASGDFKNYKGGIFNNKNCRSEFANLHHAVLLVGYGIDKKTGQKYWLIKNSWINWGINGYGKMSKDKNNQCGIATTATFPIL